MPRPLSLIPPRLAATVAVVIAAAVLLAGPTSRAEAAKMTCGSTFQVLHNDRIGELSLKAGQYDITLLDSRVISCAKASQLFARFLQDFDGVLPGRWRLNVDKAKFTKGGGFGFKVARASGGSGGGGQHPGDLTTSCPTFRVLNDDLIDRVRFPKGTYAMTAYGTLSCSAASKRFADFLQSNQNSLPRGWSLNSRTGLFSHGPSREGFQVNLRR
jgi:hypothetical protein